MDPRVITIEGRAVRVIERTPPIAPSLSLLLEGGRDAKGRLWLPLRVLSRERLHLGGATSECLRENHRLFAWIEGFHTGSDGQTRHLRLMTCRDCGAVCVRDISFDTPASYSGDPRDQSRSSLAPRRRDHVIGWYSGARPSQRVYT